MSGCDDGFEEYVMERLDDIVLQLKRIAKALEAIAQTVTPEVLEMKPEGKNRRYGTNRSVPGWEFDEETGEWHKEGSA